MNRIKRWLKYKYRPFPIWKFWKNLKWKYGRMCFLCIRKVPCDMVLFQQRACYFLHKKWGSL